MKFDVLIFDVDGTLVDSKAGVLRAADAVRRRFCGRPATAYELERAMYAANADSLLDFPDDMFGTLFEAVQEEYNAVPSGFFSGAEALVRRAFAEGAVLCILTAREKCEFASEKCIKPLEGCFSYFMFADSGFAIKPSPEPALELLRLCGVPAKRALYIGDSVGDMLCARNAGIPFAFASWGMGGDMQADFKPTDFDELSRIIFGE